MINDPTYPRRASCSLLQLHGGHMEITEKRARWTATAAEADAYERAKREGATDDEALLRASRAYDRTFEREMKRATEEHGEPVLAALESGLAATVLPEPTAADVVAATEPEAPAAEAPKRLASSSRRRGRS